MHCRHLDARSPRGDREEELLWTCMLGIGRWPATSFYGELRPTKLWKDGRHYCMYTTLRLPPWWINFITIHMIPRRRPGQCQHTAQCRWRLWYIRGQNSAGLHAGGFCGRRQRCLGIHRFFAALVSSLRPKQKDKTTHKWYNTIKTFVTQTVVDCWVKSEARAEVAIHCW